MDDKERLVGILDMEVPSKLETDIKVGEATPSEVVADHLLSHDVIPVVRCKDCKHLRTHKRCYTCPKRVGAMWDEDLMGYCSNGETEDDK